MVETKIYKQGAQFRCYKCGSPDVNSICHHCGRPMCSRHGPVSPTLRWFTENREFTNLNLGRWPLTRTQGAHCEYHVHSSPNYRLIMIAPGIAILLLGLWLFIQAVIGLGDCLLRLPPEFTPGLTGLAEVLRSPGVYDGLAVDRCYQPDLIPGIIDSARSGLVLLFGVTVLIIGNRLNKENTAAEIAGRQTEVPLGPVSESIQATEYIRGRIKLDQYGKAEVEISDEVEGEIQPNFRFTSRDILRIKEYRKKYDLDQEVDLPFQAGFLTLEGRPQINLIEYVDEEVQHLKEPEPRYRLGRIKLFWLESQIQRFPYLAGGRGRSDASWYKIWKYSVPVNGNKNAQIPNYQPRTLQERWNGIPIRIIPLLMEIGNARSLRFQVQFNPIDFPYLQPTPENIKDLKEDQVLLAEQVLVWVDPYKLGRPQSKGVISEVERPLEDGNDRVFQIEWRDLWFKIEPGVFSFELPEIRFSQAIQEGAWLRGTLRLRVPALRSGIERVRYFSALGFPVSDKRQYNQPFPFRATTFLDIEFDLALAGLPISTVMSLPCAPVECPGGPTPDRIRKLLDALDTQHGSELPDSQIYVRRVVESTPQIGEYGVESGTWHWDISGRRYHQTFPVDFHIVVYGHGDAKKGVTRADATVQSQVFEDQQVFGEERGTSRYYLESTRDEIQDTLIGILMPPDNIEGVN